MFFTILIVLLTMVQKMAVEDDVLPNGLKIPAGTRVVWSLYSLGRMEKYWGQDCRSFRPERWHDSPLPPIGVFAPFIMGPRQCLGKEMVSSMC
jgi:fatty acid omega-hydroxylase